MLRSGKFAIDNGPVFEGYTDGNTWNGWAIPYFSFDVARNIVARYCGALAHFDEDRDLFVVEPDPENELSERTEVAGTIVDVMGKQIKVYPFGTLDWTWDEVTDPS